MSCRTETPEAPDLEEARWSNPEPETASEGNAAGRVAPGSDRQGIPSTAP